MPCLWFDHQAVEAAQFYTSIFDPSKIVRTVYYGDAGPQPKGKVLTVVFKLLGQDFTALNGGPAYSITPALSFFVSCKTEKEIDTFWERLSDGGKVLMDMQTYPFSKKFGWCEDKFGVSWQIVPSILGDLLGDGMSARSARVMAALLKMNKLDIGKLQQAAAQ
jgi:predicted 3-demethylubiquinone-9 3-methyltransferase (glyoxalase superfamily)